MIRLLSYPFWRPNNSKRYKGARYCYESETFIAPGENKLGRRIIPLFRHEVYCLEHEQRREYGQAVKIILGKASCL